MGAGIFVTALIFTIALLFQKPTLSNEEIIKQAKKLGMVEADENADASTDGKDAASTDGTSADGKDAAGSADSTSADGTAADGTSKDGADSTASDSNSADAADSKDADTAKAEADAKAAEDAINNTNLSDASTSYKGNTSSESSAQAPSGLISVTISAGENSAKVSENLYRAGLIDDPIGFNDYLEQNGYDARIRQGTYHIAAGSSYDKIANAIASRK